MRRLKYGFTLAEVLITLSIIGIVAAIVIPSVMTNYQYKTMGTKLAKFLATTESATRPYVISNSNFVSQADVQDFVDSSFLGKGVAKYTSGKLTLDTNNTNYTVGSSLYSAGYNVSSRSTSAKDELLLKDGTSISVSFPGKNDSLGYTADELKNDMFNPTKYGSPSFVITFHTNVQGLPKEVRSSFDFAVTDIGYLLPKTGDSCMKYLYGNGFAVNAKDFNKTTGTCYLTTTSKKEV